MDRAIIMPVAKGRKIRHGAGRTHQYGAHIAGRQSKKLTSGSSMRRVSR